jgi:spore germination cell wall hydrolase CwlJ-like protein
MKKLLALIMLLFIVNTTAISDTNAQLKDRRCMAEAIYRESRGEPFRGQLAVGQVVLNRTKHSYFPNNICQVIFQKGQFPWTNKFDGFKATQPFIYLADIILSGKHELSNFKATHFHATYVNPKWNLRKVEQIGNHIFYKL